MVVICDAPPPPWGDACAYTQQQTLLLDGVQHTGRVHVLGVASFFVCATHWGPHRHCWRQSGGIVLCLRCMHCISSGFTHRLCTSPAALWQLVLFLHMDPGGGALGLWSGALTACCGGHARSRSQCELSLRVVQVLCLTPSLT